MQNIKKSISSRLRTLGIQGHAEVSQPAAIIIHTGVAHDLLLRALRRSRSVAGRRTLGALRHTEVSEPAAIMSSHVTTEKGFDIQNPPR